MKQFIIEIYYEGRVYQNKGEAENEEGFKKEFFSKIDPSIWDILKIKYKIEEIV